MEKFELLPRQPEPWELESGRRTVTVEGDSSVGECYRFWTVSNFNQPHRLLDSARLENLPKRAPYVRELNLVYMLGGRYEGHNEWYLGLDAEGRVQANFAGLIAQLQAALDAGYTPRIVLDNVPAAMSDPALANYYGNTAPPKDERLWHQYVRAAIEAMVAAFGREQVGSWWFRVGTEPDLRPEHWAGTKEQYFAHYDYTADAVKAVLPEARIGPGNILNPTEKDYRVFDKELWGLDIIDHAATGRNACTGGQGTPMDWFSLSWYAFVGVPLGLFDRAIGLVRERLGRYPQFANLPVVVGEYAVLGDEHGRRIVSGETTEWAASHYAALADRVYALGVQDVYEWAQTTQGVLHPRAQVIGMLERMVGGRRLAVRAEGDSPAPCSAIGCRKGEDLWLVVYHHRDLRRPSVNESVRLAVRDGRMRSGGAWRLNEWTIDDTRGTWAYLWRAEGEIAGLKPDPDVGLFEGNIEVLYGEAGVEVFRKKAEEYTGLAVTPQTRVDEAVVVGNGEWVADLEMPSHSVRLIQLSPPR